ncbi:hypothetical protein N7516_007436 [Penicillium verrucosum]|uniref:uncharacterized protein n=1 Tax=Penicillium verrucosum TaxID=60171 RepID=UPI0025455A27|nr:uncharacterized protein N7516_007436 [Penicillium verrucosum]KAJ5932947.1 hypothetical protein N7516_007436 [Penicillium verrucosum]
MRKWSIIRQSILLKGQYRARATWVILTLILTLSAPTRLSAAHKLTTYSEQSIVITPLAPKRYSRGPSLALL